MFYYAWKDWHAATRRVGGHAIWWAHYLGKSFLFLQQREEKCGPLLLWKPLPCIIVMKKTSLAEGLLLGGGIFSINTPLRHTHTPRAESGTWVTSTARNYNSSGGGGGAASSGWHISISATPTFSSQSWIGGHLLFTSSAPPPSIPTSKFFKSFDCKPFGDSNILLLVYTPHLQVVQLFPEQPLPGPVFFRCQRSLVP